MRSAQSLLGEGAGEEAELGKVKSSAWVAQYVRPDGPGAGGPAATARVLGEDSGTGRRARGTVRAAEEK